MKKATIDLLIAKRLIEKMNEDDSHLDFLAYCIACAREGHLRMHFSNSIEPSQLNVWEMEAMDTTFEQRLRSSFRALKNKKSEHLFFENDLVMLKSQKELYSQIQEAFHRVADQLYLITGGPGTGKTTHMKQVLQNEKNVALLAPTGKAANHLKSKMDHDFECSTLYSFLKKYDSFFS